MKTVQPHDHSFSNDEWPFAEPINTAAFSTRQVVSAHAPVLVVYHDHDGDWQFLHADDFEEDDCVLVCLGCALQLTPEVAELATLRPGWRAARGSPGEPWASAPYDDVE